MRQNVINAKSSMLARQPRPFCKDGALIDTTGKVHSQMMLMIEVLDYYFYYLFTF